MSSDKNNNVILVIWPSGKATVCKTVIAGSIPVITLKKRLPIWQSFFSVQARLGSSWCRRRAGDYPQ